MNSQRIRINLFLSLVDQFSVSGGNFLTVAICAHLLSQTEQGHFLFAYSSYIALLTFNIALFFSAAPVVIAQTKKPSVYAAFLARQSIRFWSFSSLLIALFFFGFGPHFGWTPRTSDLLSLVGFLFCQQGADFSRRLGYIQRDNMRVARNSLLLYGLRALGLIFLQPQSLTEIFLILALCALPWTLASCTRIFKQVDAIDDLAEDSARHWSLSKWALATTPLGWWFGYVPLFYLGSSAAPEVVAVFGNIRNLTGAANVLMELLETVVPIILARKFFSGTAGEALKTTAYVLLTGFMVWLFGAMVIYLFGSDILHIVFGASYAQHDHFFLLAWGGVISYFANRVFQVHFRASGNIHIEFFSTLIMALCLTCYLYIASDVSPERILFSYILIPFFALALQIAYAKFQKVSPHDLTA